jgi:hypothetical protein
MTERRNEVPIGRLAVHDLGAGLPILLAGAATIRQ